MEATQQTKGQGLADAVQRAARLVGHLARTIPQEWDHPSDLWEYMGILADASLNAGNRITEEMLETKESGDGLGSASAEVLIDLAHINVLASAWGEPNLVDDAASNKLLTDGWWTNVASRAGNRLQKYANIGDDWAAGLAVKGGDDA